VFAPHALALFIAAAAALILTPGPAVLFIVARSAHQGARAGLVSAMGIAAGGLVHVAAAVLGVSALLASSATAFSAVKWLGAGYLVWLGVKTLRGDRDGDEATVVEPPPASPSRLLAQGFLVNLLNPKTALFFLAFLPQFVDPSRGDVPLQMLVLGGLFVALAVVSDCTYALLAGAIVGRLGRSVRARRRSRLFTGGVYLALGAFTALSGSRTK
jgi:threonine/homoserine/homoserine lactone efflux protein